MPNSPNVQILVVENEVVIGEGVRQVLTEMGYSPVALAMSGKEAITQATRTRPDVVLMDIRLGGDMDGIEVAGKIRRELDIPIIYLTAHADDETITRAKVTEPFGYVLKPYEAKELRVAIEMALHKHKTEQQARGREEWLAKTLGSIPNAMFATNDRGRVTFVNQAAINLIGVDNICGRHICELFSLVEEKTNAPLENPALRVLRSHESIERSNGALLVRIDGSKVPTLSSAAAIMDQNQQCVGAVMLLTPTAPIEDGQASAMAEGSQRGGTPSPQQSPLSKREKEVLELVAAGHGNKEIARRLFISVRTVEFHRGRIIRKLDVENVADLIKRAITMGLTTLDTSS